MTGNIRISGLSEWRQWDKGEEEAERRKHGLGGVCEVVEGMAGWCGRPFREMVVYAMGVAIWMVYSDCAGETWSRIHSTIYLFTFIPCINP